MKPTDFSKYISDFISRYLPNEKGVSSNTITAYRDTFVLLINFIKEHKGIKVEKLTLEKIKKETNLSINAKIKAILILKSFKTNIKNNIETIP